MGQIERNWISHDGFAHFATLQLLIVGKVEHVHDQLRHRLLTDPEEYVLRVLDQEESVPLKALRGQVQGRRKDEAVLADGAGLDGSGSAGSDSRAERSKAYIGRHVVERIEARMYVWDERLGRQSRKKGVCVCTKIWGNLRAFAEADLG